MRKVAVVILNWNGKHFFEKFLDTLINNSDYPGCEIIIADNGSTDGSVEYLKKEYGNIRIIEFKDNAGYAEGYSKALKAVKAEYFVLLNSDVEVTPNWIEPVIKHMDSDKNIAASMPKLRAYESKSLFEYAGASGGYIDKFGFPFCRGRLISHLEEDTGQYDDIQPIFWASGACMFVRASSYFETGGLDGDFFAHMEEIDLCWRLKRLGYEITVCPQSSVYHVGGGTLPNNSPRKLYLNYRNSLYLLYKNLPKAKFHRILIARIGIDILSACVYIIRFDFSFFKAVFKAHNHFRKNLKSLREKRKKVLQLSTQENVSAVYKKSIIYNFFVKKKTHFSKLQSSSFSK